MSYKSITISSGHGLYVRGASGYLDEVNEARKVVNKVAEYIKQIGCKVTVIHDDVSKTKAQNITNGKSSYLVSKHNASVREVDVSVHFNAYATTSSPVGTEVLHLTEPNAAATLSKAIADAGGFKNRGAKKRTNLSFLNNTAKPALLIEVCFVDSKADADLYKKNFDKICRAIAETLTGKKIPAASSTPTPAPSTPSAPSSTAVGTLEVLCDSLNVRQSASFDAPIVKTIGKGQWYKVYALSNGLYNLGGNQWCSAGTSYVKYYPAHVVVSGESLWSIANKYGTTVAKLKSLNGLTSDMIMVGQKLLIIK